MNYQAGYNDGVNGNSAKYRSVSEYMRGFRAGEEERTRSSRMYSNDSTTYDSSINLTDVARVVETVVDLFSSDSSSSSYDSSDSSSDWGGGGGDFGGGGSSSDW